MAPSEPAVDYQMLFAETPGEMLLVFAPDWTMLAANKLWYAHTGKKPEDIVGRNLFEVFPQNPDDVDADGVNNMEASVQRVLRDKVTDAMPVHRYDIPGPDGEFLEKYWAVTHTPVLDEDGNVTHIWNRGADVTDYMLQQTGKAEGLASVDPESAEVVARQYRAVSAASRQLKEQLAELPKLESAVESAAAALAGSQERLAAVVASTSEATLTLDTSAVITTANRAAGTLFGYAQDELVGQSASMLDAADGGDEPQVLSRDSLGVLAGQEGARTQTQLKRSSGELIPVEIAVEPFAQEGQVYYAVSIRDRTEEVHRLNALVRSNRELERFAYIASHDLQAPARTIRAFVDLLREDLPADALTEDTRAYLDYLEQAATKMRAQISGLLELSRLKTDRSRYRQLDLRQVVDEALRQLEGKIEDSNATIIVDEHLGHAWGHESQLRLLFLNLIDNAIKYRDPDRAAVIEVLSESRGDSSGAKVVVRDNGIGIAAEQRERVFEVFHRLHTDAERQYPGSGIGLALCRRIVDQHDGQISIRETPDGTGTAVEILLPTEESARAAHLEIP